MINKISNSSIAILIPSTVGNGQSVDNSEDVKLFTTIFCETFGSATVTTAQYYTPDIDMDEFISEEVTIVESFGETHYVNNFFYEELRGYAKQLKDAMSKDSIIIRHNQTEKHII